MTFDAATISALLSDPAFASLRRSLDVYYGDAARDAAMDTLYARFLRAGDLAFDIGAHVGDRAGSFRRLGARVVALEPQPLCAHAIRAIYAGDGGVTLLEAACGERIGTVVLKINSANPTVSTASADFVSAADGAGGWEGQVWDTTIEVPCTTLDALVSEYGQPAFAKVDVEGFEATVLAGLSRPLPALSFEFTTIQRDVALACLGRLATLGPTASTSRSGSRFSPSTAGSRAMPWPPTSPPFRTRQIPATSIACCSAEFSDHGAVHDEIISARCGCVARPPCLAASGWHTLSCQRAGFR
jgi:FkbM family methyltransferase